MKYFLAICALSLSLTAFGQTYSLSGTALDSANQEGLASAYVILSTVNEGNQLATITNEKGEFRFEKLSSGGYKLTITYVGYKPLEKWIMMRDSDRTLEKLVLAASTATLDEVEVQGQVVQSIQKGDTTEYNAKAFKTNPDADAEGLLKKLPGVVIQNGTVQAQGEDVKQVLVDGKEFFGNDPTLALRTLPAEVIDKIQIYDRQSDQAQFTGFDDGETAKTINIVTRADRRNGQFGKVYAGYGYNNKYQLGGNVNIFKEDTRLSFIGQANNINQQNFAMEDLLGVVGGGGGSRRGGFRGGGGRGGRGGFSPGGSGGFRGGGGSAGDFLVGQQNGISTTNAFGFNYTDTWGKNWDVSGSYFFNNSSNDAVESLNRTYFLDQGATQEYAENSQSYSDNFNHRLNLRMEYQIDSSNSLIIQPRVSFQQNRGTTLQYGSTEQDGQLLNQTDNEYRSDLGGYDFSNSLLYRHRFAKQGRTFSARLNTTINHQDGASNLSAVNQSFGQNRALNDSLDQVADYLRNGWAMGANLNYTEPLGPGMMQLSYGANVRRELSDKKTYDFDEATQQYALLDTTLTNEFSSLYITQEIGTGYRYRTGALMFSADVEYQWANLSSDQVFPSEFVLNRSFTNLLPSAMLRYEISDSKNLRLFYRTNTNAPSVTQLQEVVDNSNPLQLSIGNPALDQEYQHSLFLRYSSSNTDKSSTFFAMLGGTLKDNYISNSTLIAEQDTLIGEAVLLAEGGQLSQSVNMGQQQSLRSFITYGTPIAALKSNLNLNLTGSLSQSPGLINGQENKAVNTNAGFGVVLSSNISENVDFTISSNSSYNWVTNTIRPELDDQYFNQSTNADLTLIFWKGMVFRTQLNHQLYSGLSAGYDQNFLLWNMSVGKKFLKDRKGELKLTVFDLLKQNQSIQRNVTEAYIEDTQTQVLQQYAMLTFTYQLRNFKL
uniref:TonB-dependent receptor n=1 Tax=Roseihalotalea indica TaxID=2867963 RepID=A0AA49JIS1_9BACT|nr:TonB-dependent receptor [Tunicatimonas sp. TK19036]